MNILILVVFTIIFTVIFFFVASVASERERRLIAEKLFNKTKVLFEEKHYGEAVELLRFMRWNLVSPKWFIKFIGTDKTVTRKKYMELLHASVDKLRDVGNIPPSETLKQGGLSSNELAPTTSEDGDSKSIIERVWNKSQDSLKKT